MELDKKKVLPIPIVLFSPPTQITCQLMFNGPCRKFGVFSNSKGITTTTPPHKNSAMLLMTLHVLGNKALFLLPPIQVLYCWADY